ncbi:serine/threonine-protein kinase [Geminocystis sp. NIES-3709]|uniref:serine/threonine protein kinase n=1 Tax=Geminocystis sp. NIES-3709 TaxID=1617448 RepID=UPI0005FC47B2|nr:serine/threonine-protein kinase [Geminocystis sp. NIES-3709]BAQ66248.1 serine/threonine kinase [Geminocystis sp. NIES-3709]
MNSFTSTNQILPSPYHLVKQLGSGSFGNVYLVINKTNNTQCVVKQLHLISNQPSFVSHARRLFRQEAEILRKLTYPQIPHLIDYFEEGDEFYLVEEYIQGHTLRQELVPNQSWTEKQVVELLQDGLSILAHIHEQGIIHRDVKPDNFIRRQSDNKLVLIDFGAVKEFKIEQSRLIDPTVAMGTRGYMPTEQARGKPYKNSDIYALGVIGIQALTGKNPLELEENEEGEIIWECPGIHPNLRAILEKMTRHHYKNRYQCAEVIIQDLLIYPQKENLNLNYQENINNPALNSTEVITSATAIHSVTESFTSSSISNTSNSAGKWLKSPFGATISLVLTIALVTTGGIYYFNIQEKARQEKAQEDLIASLTQKYQSQSYQECFEEIETKNRENDPSITPKALEYIGLCRLSEAKNQGNLLNYASALEIIAKIPKNDPNYSESQILIENWSTKVYTKAESLYKEKGKLEEALTEINNLPQGNIRETALVNAEKWKEEYQINNPILLQAEKDLEYNNCTDAIQTVSQIYGSNYWLLQGKKIVDRARKCLENSNKNTNNNSSTDPITPQNGVIPLCPGILCPDN